MLLLGNAPLPLHRALVRTGYQLAYGRSPLARRAAELERSQWWSPEQHREAQWQRLTRLIEHAYRTVPFYREAMQELGIEPGDIRSPEDYARLPVLSKATINQEQERLISSDFPKEQLIRTASGGSTGRPVSLYHDAAFVTEYRAVKLRNFRWAGWQPGDGWARLWGSQFDVAPHQALKQRLLDRLSRVLILPCWDLSEATMARYAKNLQQFQPDLIEAYTTPMYHFAGYLKAEGIGGIRPKGVIVSAEMLYPYQRALIEQVFQCKVYNRYGGREIGDAAHECPAGTMHLNAEHAYVEFVREGKPAAPGEAGEILLTPLGLYGMPLLRYRVEDVGSPSDAVCACGRGLPAMAVVEGRVQDLISLPQGGFLPGEFFPHLLKDFDISQFQVEQERLDKLTLRLVRGPGFSEEQLDYVLGKVREYTSGRIQVDVEFPDNIPASPSGKFRYTISHVPPAFAPAQEVERA